MELVPRLLLFLGLVHLLRKNLEIGQRLPRWDRFLKIAPVGGAAYLLLSHLPGLGFLADWFGTLMYGILLATVWFLRDYRSARLCALALVPLAGFHFLNEATAFLAPSFYESVKGYFDAAKGMSVTWLIGFGIYALVQNRKEQKERQKEAEKLRIAEARKAELEHLVAERTTELTSQKQTLETALADLRAAQVQLVHAEKMASLGELTAGIAHEIQNPLNFVNNFAELSVELAEELRAELGKDLIDKDLVEELVSDLTQNQQKINHHGKRASSIVSGMLQHARTNADGKKEPTDLNALADEYLRLSYHGLRAKDKSFNAKLVTDFDRTAGRAEVVRQDLGRVFLNLINNAFYAVRERELALAAAGENAENLPLKNPGEKFEPTVTLISRRDKTSGMVEFRIRDNGTGIPEHLRAKIFQPFFTTKPTGQGTGLGLSLAYDIVTKGHGGTMEVKTEEGRGTEFIVRLPV